MTGTRLALVLGGLGGIGKAVCESLTSKGMDVVIADRDADADPSSRSIFVDLAQRSSIDQAMELIENDHGHLDVLVNCAGIKLRNKLADADWAEAEAQLAVNTIGAWYASRRALPLLSRSQQARIVHLSSIATDARSPMSALYAASKAALETLIQEMASEWGSGQLTVNGVAPALVRTEMSRWTFDDPERLARKVSRIPTGRAIEAQEVARVIAFLCETGSGGISGQVLRVDGGASAAVEL